MDYPGTPFFSASTHEQLRRGERKAIAWGVTDALSMLLCDRQFAIEGIIDGYAPSGGSRRIGNIPVASPDILTRLSPSEHAIVFTAPERHWRTITAQIRAHGDFPVTIPFLRGREDLAYAAEWERQLLEKHVPARQERLQTARAPNKIALWAPALVPGGVERQIVLLALGLKAGGHDVTLLTGRPDHPGIASWTQRLDASGIARIILSNLENAPVALGDNPAISPQGRADLARISGYCLPMAQAIILNARHALAALQPDALICYLDQGNTMVGLAGILAGIPLIHFSGRNVCPLEFPEHTDFCVEKARLARFYRFLGRFPGVSMSNNSRAGAQSYARWLGIASERIAVIGNAFATLDCTRRRSLRKAYGFAGEDPLIVGTMRLDEEKDPLGFVDVIARCRRHMPSVRAVIIGDGYLRKAVEARIAELGLTADIRLAGNIDRPYEFFHDADLMLMSSRMEGTPNVILEAQSLGCPVIATDVGGTREVLAPCLHRYLAPHGAWPAMAAHCIELLQDRAQRQELSRQCAAYMSGYRDAGRLAEDTMNILTSWPDFRLTETA